MKHIYIKQITITNFKGIRSLTIHFDRKVRVFGRNASGKTTLLDAFLWLLFNIDSRGGSNPPVRPVDADGKWIDDIEISVEADILVDEELLMLKRTQKQVWRTKRGETVSEYTGDTNTYEINGFPCTTVREYNEKIESIVEAKLFKLLTDPTAFNALPEKEQRDILFRFVEDLTDEAVLNYDTDKYMPIREDILTAGPDKAREKAMKELRALKDEMKSYPIRIDEAARSKMLVSPETDVLARKARAEAELETIRNERDNLDASIKAYTDIQDEIAKIRIRAGEVVAKAKEEYAHQKMAARTAVTDATIKLKGLEQKRDRLSDSLSDLTRDIALGESDLEEMRRKYKETSAMTLSEGETICPTCGREFDADRIDKIKSEFAEKKENEIKRIRERGDRIAANINNAKDRIADTHKQIDALTEQIEQADAEVKRLEQEAKDIIEPDIVMLPEYQELNEQLVELSAKLDGADDGAERRGALRGREDLARQELTLANGDLSVIEANKRTDARIEELKVGQRECAQKVADQEQKLYLIEEYIRQKMTLLSDRINSRFDTVRFKLFDRQKNGAIVPCCVMQCCSNGSYVDVGHTNHSAMLLGGLEVIKSLSELYGIYAPVWLDNAEAINDYRIPRMEQQMILLSVSDDEELTVVNE